MIMIKNTKLLLEEINKENVNISLVKKYLKNGIEFNYEDKDNETILYKVLDKLNFYFRNKFDKYNNINLFDNNKETKKYLIEIIENYDYELLELLLKNNAYIKGNNLNDWKLLHVSVFSFNFKIVEYLIDVGINLNCHDKEDGWNSLLDWIEYDKSIFRDEHNIIAVIGEEMIIDIIKKKGAKGWSTKFIKNIRDELTISGYYRTGLISNDGQIKISSIPNLNDNLIKEFNNWYSKCTSERYYLNYPWEKITRINEFKKLIDENNEIGYELAKKISSHIEDDIKIYFYKINADKYLNYRHFSYCKEEIVIKKKRTSSNNR